MKRKRQPKKIATPDAFLKPFEIMKILKIGRATFYAMIEDGAIPGATKVGRQWRINSKLFWEEMNNRAA